MRILDTADTKFEYIAVPELHLNGEYYHIHVAINGYIRADLLRRYWQIALGGKGNERGSEAWESLVSNISELMFPNG